MDLFASDKCVSVFVYIYEVFSQDFYVCLLRVCVCVLRAFCLRRFAQYSLQQPGQAGYLLLHRLHTLPGFKDAQKWWLTDVSYTFYIKHNLKGFSVLSPHLKRKVKCNCFWVFCVMKSMKFPPHIKINLLLYKQQLSGLKKQISVSKVNHLPQTLVLNATKMVLTSKYSLLHYNNCIVLAHFYFKTWN